MPDSNPLDYDYLLRLKRSHPSLRLLAADHAPLIVSFLFLQFIQPNRRALPWGELAAALEDYLYHLRGLYGEDLYPKTAKQYLTDWSEGEAPFLRRYYPQGSDEPELDLTPATEKAIDWLRELKGREFVGTESRLLTVLELLRELVLGSEQDPEARIAELERRKAELDAEIARIRAGRLTPMDPTGVRERFHQAEDTARRLLADFRQVEYNFRALDRATRERIALGDRPKGEMLDQIFAGHDEIRDSDQGKSFRAFWEFLMSPQRQAELDRLLEAAYGLEPVQTLQPGEFLRQIRYRLLEAGEKVFLTNNLLVEQLRKYLDDQAWLENRRIMGLIQGIERRAVALRQQAPDERRFAELEEPRPALDLVMARGLYRPPLRVPLEELDLREGQAEVAVDALFRQAHVDEAVLRANIRRLLQRESQVSLARVLQRFPLRQGLAELVAYLTLASRDPKALVDAAEEERVELCDANGRRRLARLPKVVFVR